ncbi:unnamed protein product [Darwinula stevensoni]|uniref:Uncharacterized protein n=1 Tax=Darwinula stevensoni TaxID=69355 RepID=A0A7R9FQN5_9CRUS|nr:unnamed protein product [Darwinula stevensoni]CAG0899772.1 unnamed protein product [Darwinula stevensoni]
MGVPVVHWLVKPRTPHGRSFALRAPVREQTLKPDSSDKWTLRSEKHCCYWFDTTDEVLNAGGSGRPRAGRTEERVKVISETVKMRPKTAEVSRISNLSMPFLDPEGLKQAIDVASQNIRWDPNFKKASWRVFSAIKERKQKCVIQRRSHVEAHQFKYHT